VNQHSHEIFKRKIERTMKSMIITLGLLAFLTSAGRLPAQPYAIDWYTIDGGGGMNLTGGTYTLGGTIGQADAGHLAGSTDTVDGGFWAITALVLPRLTITLSGGNVTVCWPSPSSGFKLQQAVGLSPSNWAIVTQTPTDNGTTKCLTFPATSITTFYRLIN
jgi:hypothetical protein